MYIYQRIQDIKKIYLKIWSKQIKTKSNQIKSKLNQIQTKSNSYRFNQIQQSKQIRDL